jgi:hypothetical protein
MSLLRLKIYWEEDDTTFRMVEMLSTQTFYELHECIKKSFELPADMHASLYVSNSRWSRGREVSSKVEKNLRDAPSLSMKKTPIAALVADPHQHFIYKCEHIKGWIFLIELVTMSPEPNVQHSYPICVQSEGISPSQFGVKANEKDSVLEILELYDLDNNDEGFGDQGKESLTDEESDPQTLGDTEDI